MTSTSTSPPRRHHRIVLATAGILVLIVAAAVVWSVAPGDPPPVGPGVCTDQVAVEFSSDDTMRQHEQELREYEHTGAIGVQTREQVYEWNKRAVVDGGAPSLGGLLRVETFHATTWIATDGTDPRQVAEALETTLGAAAVKVSVRVPCSDILRISVSPPPSR